MDVLPGTADIRLPTVFGSSASAEKRLCVSHFMPLDPPADPSRVRVKRERYYDCIEPRPDIPVRVRERGRAAIDPPPPSNPITIWFWIGAGVVITLIVTKVFGL